MKILNVIIGLFLVLAIVPMVLAADEDGKIIEGGKLLITDMDVKVGSSTSKNLDFGDNIKYEAKPGDVVKFQMEFKNNFTDDEDLDIEDIEATVTILNIDDGDDLDKDAKQFDLKQGKDDKIEVQFTIPLEVDEDTYDVLIEASGDDENGTTHEVQYELTLEVQKEDNEVIFTKNSLTPSEIKCSRSVQLSTAVINTGADEEDAVVIEVANAELGVSFKETFDLTNNAFDVDSKFAKTYTFSVPQEVAPGIYTITSKVTYNNGDDTKTETADLVVAQCEIVKKEEPKEEVKKEEVVVVQPPVTQPTTPTGQVIAETITTPTLPATEEKSLFETQGFLTALIAGEVLLLVIAILLIVVIVRKRRD